MKRSIISLSALLVILVASVVAAGTAHDSAALDGYCPVAYVAMGKAVKGDPGISLDHDGSHYIFANAKAKKMFEADPEKYHVAYNGQCATGMSMGKHVDSDPTLFATEGGRTYLFSSADARKMFEADKSGVVKNADTQWAELNPAYGGYCPVAYVAMNKAIKGDPDVSMDHDGHHVVFAKPMAKEMFEKNPEKYHVAYDGYCATAVSMGKKLKSDPTIFTISDGVIYLFSSAEAKKMFDSGPAQLVGKADKQWAGLN